MITIKHATPGGQCLLVEVILHAGRMQMEIHRTANMRSWFGMLFDQPGFNVAIGRDEDDDDDDDSTENKR